MNLEKGMYVRSSLGELGTITSIVNDNLGDFGLYGQFYNTEPSVLGEVVKASPNIIDLIEVGDYVNGYRIAKIFVNKYNGKKLLIALYQEEDYEYSDKLEDYMCDDSIHIYEENIKTILTHEQFEKNCYKVIEKKMEE